MTKFDSLLTVTEVAEIAKTTRVTAINWMRNWEVDGQPLGMKRGGRWFAFPDRLIKFLQGNGSRRKNGHKTDMPESSQD
jgi:hypothetical protein